MSVTTIVGNVCSAGTARRRLVIAVGIESADAASNCVRLGNWLDIPLMFEQHTHPVSFWVLC
jgi:hypothetical protein